MWKFSSLIGGLVNLAGQIQSEADSTGGELFGNFKSVRSSDSGGQDDPRPAYLPLREIQEASKRWLKP